jgi:HemY protein
MMRLLLLSLAALVTGVGLALYSFDDTNYVVIGVGEWVVQTSLTVFLGLLFAVFMPFYIIVRTLFALWRSPRTFRAWRRDRKGRSAQVTLNRGLTLLIEGRWRSAERELIRSVDGGANPLLGYIAAARAAQALGASERRDDYLRHATDVQPTTSVAAGLTQAELHIDEQQREQALATLLQLRSHTPNHERVLALLRGLFEELRDWKSLLEILPTLKSRKLLSVAEAAQLERRAHSGLLVQSAASGDFAELVWRWGTLPKIMQNHASLLGLYIELRLRRGDAEDCESLLRAALNKDWNGGLVRLYGLVPGADEIDQLRRAEGWLQTRQDDALLLESLGRLCVRSRLWGKARSYLDASLAIESHPDTYAVLVALLDQVDDGKTAGEYARRGLAQAAPRASFLSDPEWVRVLDTPSTDLALESRPTLGDSGKSPVRAIAPS